MPRERQKQRNLVFFLFSFFKNAKAFARTDEVVVAAHDAHDDVVLAELAAQAEAHIALQRHDAVQQLRPWHVREVRVRDAHAVAAKVLHVRELPAHACAWL